MKVSELIEYRKKSAEELAVLLDNPKTSFERAMTVIISTGINNAVDALTIIAQELEVMNKRKLPPGMKQPLTEGKTKTNVKEQGEGRTPIAPPP